MEYAKPSLSFVEQADLLISRGLIVNDREKLIRILKAVSYSRLHAYWLPFTSPSKGGAWHFNKGVTLDTIWDNYRFDRQLRVLFVDAIERVEIAIRSQLVTLYTQNKSPFAYIDEKFSNWEDYEEKIARAEKQAGIINGECGKKCDLPSVIAFFHHYGDVHHHLPFWIFIDLVDFGFLSLFLKNEKGGIFVQIAKEMNLSPRVFESWLRSLNTLRNKCAHHGRVWNRVWGTRLFLPDERLHREWYETYSEELHKWIHPKKETPSKPSFINDRTAALLFICRYLLKRVAPYSQWHKRVEKLFEDYADQHIDFKAMGFPTQDWQSHPLWK
jgi:abortive infection bacteriophage resistance protein